MKPRARVSAANTHILLSGDQLPKISDNTWLRLCQIYGRHFSDDERLMIQDILNRFAENSWSLLDGRNRLKAFGRQDKAGHTKQSTKLMKFTKSLQHTIDAWNLVNQDPTLQRIFDDMDAESRVKGQQFPQAVQSMTQLQTLNVYMNVHLEKIGQKRTRNRDPFSTFVIELRETLEFMNCEVTNRGDVDAHGKPSRFVEFVVVISGLLHPDICQAPQNTRSDTAWSAWSQKIARALKKSKK